MRGRRLLGLRGDDGATEEVFPGEEGARVCEGLRGRGLADSVAIVGGDLFAGRAAAVSFFCTGLGAGLGAGFGAGMGERRTAEVVAATGSAGCVAGWETTGERRSAGVGCGGERRTAAGAGTPTGERRIADVVACAPIGERRSAGCAAGGAAPTTGERRIADGTGDFRIAEVGCEPTGERRIADVVCDPMGDLLSADVVCDPTGERRMPDDVVTSSAGIARVFGGGERRNPEPALLARSSAGIWRVCERLGEVWGWEPNMVLAAREATGVWCWARGERVVCGVEG